MKADWVRGPNALVLGGDDEQVIINEIKFGGHKSVLEFGPGRTTEVLLSTDIERIVTCEYIDKWLEAAKEQHTDPRVEVLRFTDTFPVTVEGLDPDEKFDLGIVDAPKGFNPARTVHPGYEDTSRLNACLFALERCKVVLLHDAFRPLERGTLGRLWRDGYRHDLLKTRIGMARINGTKQDDLNPQGIEEPGGVTAGPVA